MKNHINSVPEEQPGDNQQASDFIKDTTGKAIEGEEQLSDQSSDESIPPEDSPDKSQPDVESGKKRKPDKKSEKEVSQTNPETKSDEVEDVKASEENSKEGIGEKEEKEVSQKENTETKSDEVEDVETSKDNSKEGIEGKIDKGEREETTESVPDASRVKKDDRITDTRETVKYSLLSREDLIALLDEFISTRPVSEIREDVEAIKTSFYKKLKAETDQKLRDFISVGGSPEDFKPAEDPDELRMRELLKRFRELRLETNQSNEDEKQENLRKKYTIIDEIKELINSQESINKTFHDFRELQDRWRSIGAVPHGSLNDLWENYHHHVENFYDYIKINKELRDIDLKKNLEEKIKLTEKTEALLLEPNIVNAFKILQKHHENWRETGPVPKEKRSEIWDRFRLATSKLNKKHQQYFQELKEQQRNNYEQKVLMCEKVETIVEQEIDSHQEWVKKTKEILELQKVWKSIGFAPRKDNNTVYSRFRKACDSFFDNKRSFYARNMEEHNSNYQEKVELCILAEGMQESTDWKNSTDELIRLQKKWKQIGPVPRKYSDQVWKRFRAACDKFFNRKTEYFRNIDSVYENNLKHKEDLIKEIQEFKSTGNMQKDLDLLQNFQRRWTEIGYVPLNQKESIQQKFRDAINERFDELDVDEVQKNVLKFENRLENLANNPKSNQKLKFEREKFMNKLIQLRSDISVYENNIGFFANTENAEEMKKDFEQKIENAKMKIKLLEEKIKLIDDLEAED